MQRTKIGDQGKVSSLVKESHELKNIFGAIYTKLKSQEPRAKMKEPQDPRTKIKEPRYEILEVERFR